MSPIRNNHLIFAYAIKDKQTVMECRNIGFSSLKNIVKFFASNLKHIPGEIKLYIDNRTTGYEKTIIISNPNK